MLFQCWSTRTPSISESTKTGLHVGKCKLERLTEVLGSRVFCLVALVLFWISFFNVGLLGFLKILFHISI